MGTVVNLFREAAFGPEATRVMGEAFEMARRSLHDTGQPEIVQEVLAKRIIDLARKGERDPQKLCEGALRALGLDSPPN